MIKAIFFDLYNTLARFYPPREDIQTQAATTLGLELDAAGIVRGYGDADEFMTMQNARQHVGRLSAGDQRAFFTRYEQLVLFGAGVDATEEVAWLVWERVCQIPYALALYPDALPCLSTLRPKGFVLGVISNLDLDLDALARDLGLASLVDFTVSSRSAGAEKPDPRIFRAALDRAGVLPEEAIHIGDQYNSDVVGARAAGIHPVLLDRDRLLGRYTSVPRIHGLDEVPPLVEAVG